MVHGSANVMANYIFSAQMSRKSIILLKSVESDCLKRLKSVYFYSKK